MSLTVFFISFVREEKKGDQVIGRTPMGKARFLFTNPDGTLIPLPEARERVNALKALLPPDWLPEIKEETVDLTNGALHFEANCPEHGALMNEFFCGKCGKPLSPTLKP